MPSKLYGQFLAKALNKEVDWDSDTIKVALLTSSYTPNQDTHDYFDDVSTYEVTGTGYTAGGQTLGSKTVSYDAATNVIMLDAADTTWTSSTITARYAVVYDDSGATAGAKALIGYVDFSSDQSSTSGNFTITWDATGIVRITVA
jgi:predicted anti-sigma-YlaC factor YlaD